MVLLSEGVANDRVHRGTVGTIRGGTRARRDCNRVPTRSDLGIIKAAKASVNESKCEVDFTSKHKVGEEWEEIREGGSLQSA